MSRERVAAGQHAPTGPYYDHGDRLNELWVEWVNIVLELKLDPIVRCRHVEHSGGTNILSWVLRCLVALRRLGGSVTSITSQRRRFGLVQKESQDDVAKIWSRFLWSRNAVKYSRSGRRG